MYGLFVSLRELCKDMKTRCLAREEQLTCYRDARLRRHQQFVIRACSILPARSNCAVGQRRRATSKRQERKKAQRMRDSLLQNDSLGSRQATTKRSQRNYLRRFAVAPLGKSPTFAPFL